MHLAAVCCLAHTVIVSKPDWGDMWTVYTLLHLNDWLTLSMLNSLWGVNLADNHDPHCELHWGQLAVCSDEGYVER